jgi:transcriptional regulator with XRE-family HTH domain
MKKNVINKNYRRIVVDIARRIRLARLERGYNQGKIAIYLGQSQSYVSKIESGKQPVAAAELKLVAEFYKRPIPYFYD